MRLIDKREVCVCVRVLSFVAGGGQKREREREERATRAIDKQNGLLFVFFRSAHAFCNAHRRESVKRGEESSSRRGRSKDGVAVVKNGAPHQRATMPEVRQQRVRSQRSERKRTEGEAAAAPAQSARARRLMRWRAARKTSAHTPTSPTRARAHRDGGRSMPPAVAAIRTREEGEGEEGGTSFFCLFSSCVSFFPSQPPFTAPRAPTPRRAPSHARRPTPAPVPPCFTRPKSSPKRGRSARFGSRPTWSVA